MAATTSCSDWAATIRCIGGDGGDWLEGGADTDQMTGGKGDDVYVLDDAGDKITENAGEGFDAIRTTFSIYTIAATFEALEFLARRRGPRSAPATPRTTSWRPTLSATSWTARPATTLSSATTATTR